MGASGTAVTENVVSYWSLRATISSPARRLRRASRTASSTTPSPSICSATTPSIPRSQFKDIPENAVSRTQPGDTPGGTGRFAQISDFSYTFSGSRTAQVLNPDGTLAVPGTRVQEVVLDDGTVIVTGGALVAGPDLTFATIDFLARGGVENPYRGAPFNVLGASYQQALSNYVVNPLVGLISDADYPASGEGRITEVP